MVKSTVRTAKITEPVYRLQKYWSVVFIILVTNICYLFYYNTALLDILLIGPMSHINSEPESNYFLYDINNAHAIN